MFLVIVKRFGIRSAEFFLKAQKISAIPCGYIIIFYNTLRIDYPVNIYNFVLIARLSDYITAAVAITGNNAAVMVCNFNSIGSISLDISGLITQSIYGYVINADQIFPITMLFIDGTNCYIYPIFLLIRDNIK